MKLHQLNPLTNLSPANALLIMAFIVAIPRQMGVNGHLIGFDPTTWAWFAPLEVYSGIAMAVLEGLAIAFVAKRWRIIQTDSLIKWIAKTLILAGMVYLAGAISITTSMYATAAQKHMLVGSFFTTYWAVFAWSTLVTSVNPFIALLIGLVDHEERKESQGGYQSATWKFPSMPNKGITKTDTPKSEPEAIPAPKPNPFQSDPDVAKRRACLLNMIKQGWERKDMINFIKEHEGWPTYNANTYNADRRILKTENPDVF